MDARASQKFSLRMQASCVTIGAMKHHDPRQWLSTHAIPFWLSKGRERRVGGFVENVSRAGEPLTGARRCMVQARQIYSMAVAMRMQAGNTAELREAFTGGVRVLTERFSKPDGSFRHSIDEEGAPKDETPDLYGQAFALFGLAEGFALLSEPALKKRALLLVTYLRRERAAKGGGFTEIECGTIVYRSNPLMHLFEAALAWLEYDSTEPEWKKLADEILELALNRFFDPSNGAIGEYFDEGWNRRLEAGRYVYEPGHLCEWSWLMGRYQALTGRDLLKVRNTLYDLAESTGIDPGRGTLIDQVWSGGAPKLNTSRFWPQCERIKAAAQLGRAESAKAAMSALLCYFDTPVNGLWNDTWDENGAFDERPVKSSSLYHIIGAISEFVKLG
jgi:mannose/cellobiose epimerase-like protein (N-acyl-D-glucosamine 2-epimerase family)